MNHSVERILDANLNRVREGLRVVEEYARFILENDEISCTIKTLRHQFSESERQLCTYIPKLIENRDSSSDIGEQIKTPSEQTRADVRAVAIANIKRVQEGLRVLDEYAKICHLEISVTFESCRYRAYEIESKLSCLSDRFTLLRKARLYVLITEKLSSASSLKTVEEVIAGGADMIQLREKDMEDSAFLELAEAAGELCSKHKVLLILNDRTHLVGFSGADGAHTGWGDLQLRYSRKLVGYDRILGRSTSNSDAAMQAFEEGADYIGVGPVFPTQTKEHRAAVGLEYVKWASKNARVPYFCIGSINRNTIDSVLNAGANAVAVCTAIIGAKDIASETAWYKSKLNSYGYML